MHKVVNKKKFMECIKALGFEGQEYAAIAVALDQAASCTLDDDDLATLTKSFTRSALCEETLDKLDSIPFNERSFKFNPYDALREMPAPIRPLS